MAQLTIEVPDALLPEFERVRSQLPELLTQWVTASRSLQDEVGQTASQEVLIFLMMQPTPQAILQFKVSESAQGRLRILLDRNRGGALSEDETVELKSYEQLDRFMQMLKIRACAIVASVKS